MVGNFMVLSTLIVWGEYLAFKTIWTQTIGTLGLLVSLGAVRRGLGVAGVGPQSRGWKLPDGRVGLRGEGGFKMPELGCLGEVLDQEVVVDLKYRKTKLDLIPRYE